MQLRVATALFGHMGLELNLQTETPDNLEILKAGLALHKTHRGLIHDGDFHRLDTPQHVNAVGVVARDQSEALISWCIRYIVWRAGSSGNIRARAITGINFFRTLQLR